MKKKKFKSGVFKKNTGKRERNSKKKEEREKEIGLLFKQKVKSINEHKEIVNLREFLSFKIDGKVLFEIDSELKILNTLMSASGIGSLLNYDEVTKLRCLNLFKIVKYHNDVPQLESCTFFKYIIEEIYNRKDFAEGIEEKCCMNLYKSLASRNPQLRDIITLQHYIIKQIIKASFTQKIENINQIEDFLPKYKKNKKEYMVTIIEEILKENKNRDDFLQQFDYCQRFYNRLYSEGIYNKNLSLIREKSVNNESFSNLNPEPIDLTLLKLFNECSKKFGKTTEDRIHLNKRFCKLIVEVKALDAQLSWNDLFSQVEEELEFSNKIILKQWFFFTIYNTLKTEDDKKEFIDYILTQKEIIKDYIEKNKDNEKIKKWKDEYIKILKEFFKIKYKTDDINHYIRDVFDVPFNNEVSVNQETINNVEKALLKDRFQQKVQYRILNHLLQGQLGGYFTEEEIKKLAANNDIYIDNDRYIKFFSDEAPHLTEVQIKDLGVNIWKCLEINDLSKNQIKALSKEQIGEITQEMIQFLGDQIWIYVNISDLSKDQIKALNEAQMKSLPDAQIKRMLNGDDSPINKFSITQLHKLGFNRIERCKGNLLQELTLDQIKLLGDEIKNISSDMCKKYLKKNSLNEVQVLHLLKPTYYKILFPLSFLSGSALIINNVDQISHLLFKNNTNNRICSISKFFKNNKKSINYVFGAIAAVSIAHLCKTRYDNWQIINKFLKKKEALT